jgi:ABC-type transport system involved in multi-copper enzyme maturation permease subunit
MSWHGTRTVAALELRQRVRTSRWPVVLAVWFLVVALVAFLAYYATKDPDLRSGQAMYDVVIFFVLGLAMLIVPSLTATSVNGDREHGVLATLQTTLLTQWDIVLGKLAAAWVIAVTFLAWSWLEGGVGAGRIVLSVVVLVVVLAVICAVGLMFSTLTARPVASAVLTYLVMGALVFGTTIGFGLGAFLVTDQEQQKVFGVPDTWWEQHQPANIDPSDPTLTQDQLKQLQEAQGPTEADCTNFTRTTGVAHTERIWWVLPLNPFVVVADVAPSQARTVGGRYVTAGFTPMRWISAGARMARNGPAEVQQECHFQNDLSADPAGAIGDPMDEALQTAPVWPIGLGFLLALGAGSVIVAAQRLRTPIRRLPNGTRIA